MAESQPNADDLARRLREAVQKQRPRAGGKLLWAVLILGLPLTLLGWLLAPWSRPPELMVIGFDHVAPLGKAVVVRAATEPPASEDSRWGGQVLYFEEMTPDPADRTKPLEVRTDKNGVANQQWTVKTPDGVAEIEARYIDERLRPPWFSRARSRVFLWPGGTRLLVLDVEPTLKNAGDWPELVKALAAAKSAGWQLVYLAAGADTPLAYARQRDWVIRQATADSLPLVDAPVLGRRTLFQGETDAAARKAVCTGLKSDFGGAMIYVTAERELTLHNVGAAGDLEAEPRRLTGWSDLAAALPK